MQLEAVRSRFFEQLRESLLDPDADGLVGNRGVTVTLKDGSEVPVSRTYARLLRERGWI